jgi:uncharacterized protein with HEPN domain
VSFEYDPADCLTDILDNIARIQGYAAGLNRNNFADEGKTQDAIERCLERVCEAMSRLGNRTAELMPGQPSAAIRGMGNRLRHAYDRIDLGLIWDTIETDLPSLKADAERALSMLRAARLHPHGDAP